jgi:flagellar motor switch protein FliG
MPEQTVLSGDVKTAILFIAMGPERAGEVMQYLKPKQVEKITLVMENLPNVNSAVLEQTLEEFIKSTEKTTGLINQALATKQSEEI